MVRSAFTGDLLEHGCDSGSIASFLDESGEEAYQVQ